MDPIARFKEVQRAGWAHFLPVEAVTTPPAAELVGFAGVRAGHQVLDVGCGSGVVALTAAACGAQVAAIDLTPELLARARENAAIAQQSVDWREGDAEALPFADGGFDAVLSQFGHMFAPRPEVAVREMLRVLRPGGVLAFSTWAPELMNGRLFSLVERFRPLPPGVPSPVLWGDPAVVRERLGSAVRDLEFNRGTMWAPALSARHHLLFTERGAGPLVNLVRAMSESQPERLAQLRAEHLSIIETYFEDNWVRQDFLMSRAIKV